MGSVLHSCRVLLGLPGQFGALPSRSDGSCSLRLAEDSAQRQASVGHKAAALPSLRKLHVWNESCQQKAGFENKQCFRLRVKGVHRAEVEGRPLSNCPGSCILRFLKKGICSETLRNTGLDREHVDRDLA